jgi:hypothetical protein
VVWDAGRRDAEPLSVTDRGGERFEQIFTDLLLVCDQAGLVGHGESYYDMTGVAASATQATPYQRAVILSKALSTWLDADHGGVGTLDRDDIAAIALEVLAAQHPSLKTVEPSQLVESQQASGGCVSEDRLAGSAWWPRLVQAYSGLSRPASTTAEALRQAAQTLVPALPQAFGDPERPRWGTRGRRGRCAATAAAFWWMPNVASSPPSPW